VTIKCNDAYFSISDFLNVGQISVFDCHHTLTCKLTLTYLLGVVIEVDVLLLAFVNQHI
jgi:hypothetical protein